MAHFKEHWATAKPQALGLEAVDWRRICYALRFAPALFFLLLCLASLPPYQGAGDDAAIYEGVADSILQGEGYTLNGRPQVKFPPAFPVTLALLKFFAGSERIYILAMAGFGAAALLFLSLLLIRIEGPVFAFAATSILAVSPHYLLLALGSTRSDAVFMLFTYICLLLLHPVRPSQSRAGLLWLPVLLPYTVLLRSVGIALIAAACFDGRETRLHRTLQEKAVPVVFAAIAMGAWMIWAHENRRPPWPGAYMDSYMAQLMMKDPHRPGEGTAGIADLFERVAANAVSQSAHAVESLAALTWIAPLWFSPLFVALWGVFACGLWASRKKIDPVMIFTLGYLAIIMLWPFDEGQRFLLPVVPFVLVYLWRGVRFIYSKLRRRRFSFPRSSYITVSCVLLILAAAAVAGGALQRGLQSRVSVAALAALIITGFAAALFPDQTGRLLRRTSIPRSLPVLLLLILIAHGLAGAVRQSQGLSTQKPADGRHFPTVEAGRWIRVNTSEADVVMAQQSNILHRESGRLTAAFPVTGDPSLIIKTLQHEKARYLLIIADKDYPYFLPTEEQRLKSVLTYRPDCFELVKEAGQFWIYSFKLTAPGCGG